MFLNGNPVVYPPSRKPAQLIDGTFYKAIDTLLKPYSTYMEIGTYDGMTISSLAKKYPEKEFYAVDSFRESGRSGFGCLQFFIMHNADLDNVHLFAEMSQAVLPLWINEGKKFGFILVDGDHSFAGAFNDLCLSYVMLEQGGILLFHDYGATHMGVTQAVDVFKGLIGKGTTRKMGVDFIVK